ncbi:MAG: hypothetical protein AUJ85_02210 [Elusimicrobia bacterium CG1_02_37_114]|nr:MAG: hypothetical protein AUJ85_02210 [Elusimicrobia bacterium CG1_02_37_114]PIV53655.1 MAG: VapC toxin family PIN domain ribonuclease [Elusimicrobia bacterium CG02_land_8_20_14_3_00_37_13]PIZ13472.1 MAG: VapC toxin family PIN domain ribonuclease [Elusimicrobia bacterium CG_4_10_14_0_8_um_filter_37_32]
MIPINILLDTTILIDIFRGCRPAIDWLKSQSDKNIGISGFAVFEILQGSRNKEEMLSLQKKLEKFPVFWPTEDDCNRALATFANLYLSHGVEVIDVLIAYTTIGLDIPIVTLNEKHFKPISGLKTIIPYQ